jgi:NADH:ubiquinone oxidoreductase subunit F (NADH-binding)
MLISVKKGQAVADFLRPLVAGQCVPCREITVWLRVKGKQMIAEDGRGRSSKDP